MKKIILSGIIISITFFACKDDSKSVEKTNETKVETTHLKSDSLKLEFDFPKNWQAIKNPANPNVINLQEPLKDSLDKYHENIMIWSEQLPMNITDSLYHLTAIAQLKISNPKFDIQNIGPETIGNLKFYKYEFDFSPADSQKYRVQGFTYYNQKDSTGYNFNGTSTMEDNRVLSIEMKRILTSFKTR